MIAMGYLFPLHGRSRQCPWPRGPFVFASLNYLENLAGLFQRRQLSSHQWQFLHFPSAAAPPECCSKLFRMRVINDMNWSNSSWERPSIAT